jgi:hypothetical protein
VARSDKHGGDEASCPCQNPAARVSARPAVSHPQLYDIRIRLNRFRVRGGLAFVVRTISLIRFGERLIFSAGCQPLTPDGECCDFASGSLGVPARA